MIRVDAWHQFFIALEAQCCYALEQKELRQNPDWMRLKSRRLFWSRWTRDRMHFLAGRRFGQSDLKGFTFGYRDTFHTGGGHRHCDCCPIEKHFK